MSSEDEDLDLESGESDDGSDIRDHQDEDVSNIE